MSFTPPTDTGGESISSYQFSANGGEWRSTSGSTATGLSNGVDYTVRLRACNAIGCGSPSQPSQQIVPFGPPNVSVLSSGGLVTWSWNGQPGVDSYNVSGPSGGAHNGNSFTYDAGFGPARGFDLSISANGQGRTSGTATVRGTTQDTRSVNISAGAPASVAGCSDTSRCVRIHMNAQGFDHSNHTITCSTDWSGGAGQFWTQAIVFGPSWSGDLQCAAGTGANYWIEVDGVRSNNLTR